jgi:hypothetical protein
MPIDFGTINSTSPLARYRILSPQCGLRVSPLQLGAMSIGEAWSDGGFGLMNKEMSFKLLDKFYELLVIRILNMPNSQVMYLCNQGR